MTPEPRRKKSRAELVLLVLFALSVLSFVYSLATMVRELRRAEAMRTQPVWATLDGPAFELHAGATGSWEPKWLPVEGAIGSPVLWLDVSVPDIETAMRVLVRFDPLDSAHPYDPKRTSVDGEWELGDRLATPARSCSIRSDCGASTGAS